ncbi:hypothetical protein P7C70_g3520, partial [Phenoliferia sp. Uapishka_3]
MIVHVLDNYYLAITFLISLGLQGALFIISFSLQTDKLTDLGEHFYAFWKTVGQSDVWLTLGGSANFFLLAIVTLTAGNTFYTRNIVASVLVLVWSARLGGFLFFRVLKTGKDGRFDEMRSKFFSFMGFWAFQLFWVWTVSLPLTILNSPNVSDPSLGGGNPAFGSSRDIVGIIMWAIGFASEAISDQQKYMYKSSKPPKGAINDRGVWHFTRHPNFFGEIFLWWGMYILCLEPAVAHAIGSGARKAQYASIVGPIFITLLLFFVSGLPLAEKPTAKKYYLMSHGQNPLPGDKWADYKAYLSRTSILFPIPPPLYRHLPGIMKRTVLLDFPMFKFDEHADGPAAVEEERRKSAAGGE